MLTVLFNSEKGGTGKTTLSVLAASMLAAQGYRTLLVDFDAQAHATISLGVSKAPGVYDCLVREIDVKARRVCVEPERYMLPGMASDGVLWLLPGNSETHGIPFQTDNVAALAETIEDADDVDVCIVDSAPSAGMLLNFAWAAADAVVIPSKMEMLSMDGVAGTMRRAERSGVRVLGIVPNKVREQTRLHSEYLSGLQGQAKESDVFVFEPIADRIVWAEASSVQHALTGLEGEVGKARAEGIRFVNQLIERMRWLRF